MHCHLIRNAVISNYRLILFKFSLSAPTSWQQLPLVEYSCISRFYSVLINIFDKVRLGILLLASLLGHFQIGSATLYFRSTGDSSMSSDEELRLVNEVDVKRTAIAAQACWWSHRPEIVGVFLRFHLKQINCRKDCKMEWQSRIFPKKVGKSRSSRSDANGP